MAGDAGAPGEGRQPASIGNWRNPPPTFKRICLSLMLWVSLGRQSRELEYVWRAMGPSWSWQTRLDGLVVGTRADRLATSSRSLLSRLSSLWSKLACPRPLLSIANDHQRPWLVGPPWSLDRAWLRYKAGCRPSMNHTVGNQSGFAFCCCIDRVVLNNAVTATSYHCNVQQKARPHDSQCKNTRILLQV